MRYKDLLTEKINNKPSNLALYLANRHKVVVQIIADLEKAEALATKHDDGASIIRSAMRYSSGEDITPYDIEPRQLAYLYRNPLKSLELTLDSYRRHGTQFLEYLYRAVETAKTVRPLTSDQKAALAALPNAHLGLRDYGFDDGPETEADPDYQHAMGYLMALRLGADARARLVALIGDMDEKIGALWHRYTNLYNDKYRPEHDEVETLYHTTAFATEILRDGFKAEKPVGRRGLGNYGDQEGISFTHRYKIAHDLWRSLREIWMIAHGKLTAKQIVGWIRAEGMDKMYPDLATTVGIGVKMPAPDKPAASTGPAKSERENAEDHKQALADTGFWGKKGAGCIVMARDTGRFLIAHRSKHVQEPNTWGTWGGAIDSSEDPQEAAMRELIEETGFDGSVLAEFPLMVFRKGSFAYHNYLFIVDEEYTPELDWENQGYRWCSWGQWPTPLHFGLDGLLRDAGTAKLISQLIGDRRRVKKLDELSGPEETVKLYRVYLALSKIRTDPVFTYIEETMEMMKTREESDIGILACDVRLDQSDEYLDGEAEFRVPADRVSKIKRVL